MLGFAFQIVQIVATFSIVAYDSETGALGCAVESRYFPE